MKYKIPAPVSSGSQPSPAIRSRAFLAAAFLCAVCLQPDALAGENGEDEGKPEAEFVEPILTEETMPNEPRELSLRVSTDFRKGGGESIGSLPKVELFYGLAERLGAELSVPFAYTRWPVDWNGFQFGQINC